MEWRAHRQAAAARYKPEHIRLLLVAEAPPAALDRYFYFEEVAVQDSLFRYVARLVLGLEPTRFNKPQILAELRSAGVFLIDLCLDPVADKSDLPRCVAGLVERVQALRPDHIILIKATDHDAAFAALARTQMPVVDQRIPFPGSGQQRRFEEGMRLALNRIGWDRGR
jgi:hypothetical protein